MKLQALGLFIVLLSFSSCVIDQAIKTQKIVGRYQKINAETNLVEVIHLMSDNTFEYRSYGEKRLKTLGKWRLDDDFVILHSYAQPNNELDFGLIELPKNIDKSIYQIKIHDEAGQDMPGPSCQLRNIAAILSKDTTNNQGICTLTHMADATSLVIEHPGYKTVAIPLKQLESQNLIIQLKIDLGTYGYFTNRKMLINANKMFDLSINQEERGELHYKKIMQ